MRNDPVNETCYVSTPMFTYGNSNTLELRPSELKGLLRYMFRISTVALESKPLFKLESELFGGLVAAESKDEKTKKYASPLRVRLERLEKTKELEKKSKSLLLHKKSSSMDCYWDVSLDLSLDIIRFPKRFQNQEKGLEIGWKFYTDLLELSLTLGGIGKRVRRGRGCLDLDHFKERKVSEMAVWIVDRLNAMNFGNEVYEVSENIITRKQDYIQNGPQRPIIERIQFGKIKSKHDIMDYLKVLDKASHEMNVDYFKSYNTEIGDQKKPKNKKVFAFATGSIAGGKFASSIIVSLTQVAEGYLPIYTWVTPIFKGKELDQDKKERLRFIKLIENGGLE